MLIAKIESGNITVADYRTMFPQTSFPPSGPSDEFLAENSCMKVNAFKAHDKATQKLAACEPYIEGEWVYTVEVVEKSAEELAADQAEKTNQLIKAIETATQARLDDFAKTKGYDNIISACSYATSDSKYGVEGKYCVSAREATWDKLFEILAEVQSGTRPVPSGYADIEPDLPVLEWPVV